VNGGCGEEELYHVWASASESIGWHLQSAESCAGNRASGKSEAWRRKRKARENSIVSSAIIEAENKCAAAKAASGVSAKISKLNQSAKTVESVAS